MFDHKKTDEQVFIYIKVTLHVYEQKDEKYNRRSTLKIIYVKFR